MILLDANVLIYAYDRGSPYNDRVRPWLDERLNGIAKVGIPWASFLAFTRIVTNPRIYTSPAPAREAWLQVQSWAGAAATWIPQPTEHHLETVSALLKKKSIQANDIPDIHLVALALEHGLKICSTDSDFARYREIEWINPLDETNPREPEYSS